MMSFPSGIMDMDMSVIKHKAQLLSRSSLVPVRPMYLDRGPPVCRLSMWHVERGCVIPMSVCLFPLLWPLQNQRSRQWPEGRRLGGSGEKQAIGGLAESRCTHPIKVREGM